MKTQALQIQQPTHIMEDYADKISELQDLMREHLNSQIIQDSRSFQIILTYKYSNHVQFIGKDEIFDYDPDELNFLSVDDEINIQDSFYQVLQRYEHEGWIIVSKEISRNWLKKFFGVRPKFLLTFTLSEFGWGVFFILDEGITIDNMSINIYSR